MQTAAVSKRFFVDGIIGCGNGWLICALILLALLVSVLFAPVHDAGSRRCRPGHHRAHRNGRKCRIPAARSQGGQDPLRACPGGSGNLDPFLILIRPGTDFAALQQAFRTELEKTITEGGDPLVMIPEFAERHNILWDDDSGKGYAAALRFKIPADGTYFLAVRSSFARQTFGHYRLLVGNDEPSILSGNARARGGPVARLESRGTAAGTSVQEVSVKTTTEKPDTYIFLNDRKAGQTLALFTEGKPGKMPQTYQLFVALSPSIISRFLRI